MGGIGALCAVTPLISSWFPSAKVQAEGAPVQVDLSNLEPGEQAVVEWRGKPVWIIRRTKEMLQRLTTHSSRLRDPHSRTRQQPSYATNAHRSINPEYLVLIGICTHLGCSPKYKPNLGDLGPDWPGGFFAPAMVLRSIFQAEFLKMFLPRLIWKYHPIILSMNILWS